MDHQTGKIIKHQPYRYQVDREKGGRFYRDGKCFFEDGTVDTSYLAPQPKPSTQTEAKGGHVDIKLR